MVSSGLISLLSTPIVLPGVGLPIPLVVWCLILLMFALSVIHWLWLFRQAVPLYKQLQGVNQSLRGLQADSTSMGNTTTAAYPVRGITAPQLETLQARIRLMASIAPVWLNWQQTLLTLPDALNPDLPVVWATQAPEISFNRHSLLESQRFDLAWFQAFPGVLTSLGLLGTFLALLLGLSFVSVHGNGQVAGIEDLINSLSGKFASSVVGLVLSLLFLAAEKSWVARLENQIHTLQILLSQCFRRTTPEHMLSRIAQDMEHQSVAFRQFFSTELSNTLASSFQESMSPQMDRMVVAIEGLQQVTQALGREKNESLSETLTPLFDQFHTTMAEMAQSFRQSLTQGASQEIGQLTQSLEQAALFMQGMQQGGQEQQAQFGQIISRLEETMAAMAQQQTGQAQQLQGTVQTLLTTTLGQVETHLGAVHQQQLAQSEQQLQQREQLAVQGQSLNEGLLQLNDLLKQHRSSFERLYLAAQTLETGLPAIKTLVEETSTASQEALQTHAATLPQLGELMRGLTQAVTQTDMLLKLQRSLYEDVDGKLARMLGQLHEAFDQYHTAMGDGYREQHESFQNHLSGATAALGQTVLELQERLDDLSELFDRLPAPAAEKAAV